MLDCFLFSCHVKGIIQLSACPKTHSFIPSFFSVFSTSSPRILILVCLAANPVLYPSSTSCDTLPGRLLEGSHLPVLCAYGNHTNCLLTALPSFCLEAGLRFHRGVQTPLQGTQRKLALSLALGVDLDWLKPYLVVSLFCQRQLQF